MTTAKGTITAKDIMHRGAQWLPAHETLDRAAQLMRELDVGALPIADSAERLTGILTDRDIVVGCVAMGHDPAQTTAGEMTHGTPRWIDSGADVDEVLREMKSHRIHAAPGDRGQASRRDDQRVRSGAPRLRGADRRMGRRGLRTDLIRAQP